MRLIPRQRQLEVIDGTLRDEAPALAAKYDIFTRLTHDEGDPPSEQRFRPERPRRHGLAAWWWRWSGPFRRLRVISGPVRA